LNALEPRAPAPIPRSWLTPIYYVSYNSFIVKLFCSLTFFLFPDLKLILMSATIDLKKFKSFFPKSADIIVKGRCFDIKRFYLEDVLKMTNYQKHTRGKRTNAKHWQAKESRYKELYNPGKNLLKKFWHIKNKLRV